MAVKCKILKAALAKLNKVQWGISCNEREVNSDFISGYIKNLNIPNGKPDFCDDEDDLPCTDIINVINCKMNILGTTMQVSENILDFDLSVGQVLGGKLPFTYSWTFDEQHFMSASPTDQSSIKLVLKPGKSLPALVSNITVRITDAEGCSDTKTCTIVNGALNCITSYTPCANPNNLVVINTYVTCSAPTGLIVTKLN